MQTTQHTFQSDQQFAITQHVRSIRGIHWSSSISVRNGTTWHGLATWKKMSQSAECVARVVPQWYASNE
jgi:hypothetical protein